MKLVLIAILLIPMIVYSGESKPLSSTECWSLREAYKESLQLRVESMQLGIHNKRFDKTVAYDAKNLIAHPECITEKMDKPKVEMWANQYYYLR